MIVGIGVDLIELNRIREAVEKNERLAKRVLTKNEFMQYESLSLHRKVEFLAGRFAAKEATSKALGVGIGGRLSFQQMEISVNDLGAPALQISSPFLETEGLSIYLSISHSRENAIAQVLLERLADVDEI